MRSKIGKIVSSLSLAWIVWGGAGSHAPHAGYEPLGSYPSLDECSRVAAQLTQTATRTGTNRTYVCLPERVDPRLPKKALGMLERSGPDA
jgi:hypothetical protein